VSLRKSRASTLGRARRPSKLLKHSMPFAMLSTPNARARRALRAQSRARHDLAARQGGIGRSAPRGSGRGVLGCDEDGVKLAHAMRHLSGWGQIGDAREKATQRQPVLCRELTLLPQYRLPAAVPRYVVYFRARGSTGRSCQYAVPAARPSATRAAAAQRSAPSEAAGGPHNRQNHASRDDRPRGVIAEFTMVMESVTKPQNAYQRHGFWRGEALVPGTDGGPSATQAFAFCFIGSTAFRNKGEGRRART